MKDPNFQEITTGTTPAGRSVRVVKRSIPNVGSIYTLASGNVIWNNGTLDEMLLQFDLVTENGLACTDGGVL